MHAYVLMSNHFHLLATPETADGLPKMMQAVGRSYVRYFNDRQGRSGTLWEGRYRSTLIQTDRYLLACMAYIDLNPVRAGMVAQAAGLPVVEPRALHGCSGRTSLITPASAVLGAGQHAVCPRSGVRRIGAMRVSAPVQQAALTDCRAARMGAGRGRFCGRFAKKNRTASGAQSRAGRPVSRTKNA